MASPYLSEGINLMLDRITNSREMLENSPEVSFARLLQRLRMTLLSANAVLVDAEQRAGNVQEVERWLMELVHAFLQAEDLFDEISSELLRRRLENEARSVVRQLQYIIAPPESLSKKVGTKMEKIVGRLECLVNQIPALGLREQIYSFQRKWSRSSLYLPQRRVIGREDDKQAIVNMLLSDDGNGQERTCVIPIVGMPGVGKSTLADAVYKELKIQEHFDLKAWVFVGEVFDVIKVSRSILLDITSSATDLDEPHSVQAKLKSILSGKTLLLVLDDFWAENYLEWEQFLVGLTDGTAKSKIILTTRCEIASSIFKTVHRYPLRLLDDEDCWKLISGLALGCISTGSLDLELEATGKSIARQCKGLPLSATAIAYYLRSVPNTEDWNAVPRNFPHYTASLLPNLKRSYDSLSSRLKQCFAFCSIFSKGYVFEKERLILLWMSIGLLYRRGSNKRLEDIGNEYLDELVRRSFFLPLDNDKTSFMMHDLINDLAKSISGDFCCRLEDNWSTNIPTKARHLSFLGSQCDPSMIFESIHGSKFLRTILPLEQPLDLDSLQLTERVLHELLSALGCLRVLSLSHYHITMLPESLGGLKLLRYLDLSGTRIRRLDDFVCTLYTLQILLLSNCHALARLPRKIGRLMNLRYLDLVETPLTEMPLGISKLRNLQKLSNFVVGRWGGAGLRELKELSYLYGKLEISELQNVVCATEADGAALTTKQYLEELVLKWAVNVAEFYPGRDRAFSCDQKQVLERLQPHQNLKKLSIVSYGGPKFPNWIGDSSFSNVVSVHLSSCNFCLSLPPMGQLPSLQHLVIENFERILIVGPEFAYGAKGSSIRPFQSLQTLNFNSLIRWEQWITPEHEGGIFPCLKELCIHNCPQLTNSLPSDLSALTQVVISECPINCQS